MCHGNELAPVVRNGSVATLQKDADFGNYPARVHYKLGGQSELRAIMAVTRDPDWFYQDPLRADEHWVGPLSTAALVELMIDGPLDDSTWCRMGDGEAGFASSFQEIGEALLEAIDRLVPRWVGRPVKPPHWAHGWFMFVAEQQPDLAMRVIVALVDRARSDEELASIGAGMMETLLRQHGPDVAPLFESECQRSPRFRKALSAVWRTTIREDVWQKLQAAFAGGTSRPTRR